VHIEPARAGSTRETNVIEPDEKVAGGTILESIDCCHTCARRTAWYPAGQLVCRCLEQDHLLRLDSGARDAAPTGQDVGGHRALRRKEQARHDDPVGAPFTQVIGIRGTNAGQGRQHLDAHLLAARCLDRELRVGGLHDEVVAATTEQHEVRVLQRAL